MSKTIEEIKEQYAKEQKQVSWEDVIICHKKSRYYGFLYNKAIDDVAERYAQSQTQELIESMGEIHAITEKSSAGGIHIGNIRTIVDRVLTKYNHLNQL